MYEPSAPNFEQYPSHVPTVVAHAQAIGRVREIAPELVDEVSSASIELVNVGLEHHKARVALVLDISASMENPNQFFSTNIPGQKCKVQELIEKALSMACLFDDDFEIELFLFGEEGYGPFAISLKDYQQQIDGIISKLWNPDAADKEFPSRGFEGYTNYGTAAFQVRNYYFKDVGTKPQSATAEDLPVFALFVTDGDCNRQFQAAAKSQFRASSFQPIFWKFLALKGHQKDATFDFLQGIDDARVAEEGQAFSRFTEFYIDNSDLKVVRDPASLTFQDLVEEYPAYCLEAFQKKGLLSQDPAIDERKARKDAQDGRRVANKRCSIL